MIVIHFLCLLSTPTADFLRIPVQEREVFVSTGSLLLQHIHSVCVCLNMSQQDSMDTQNILKPYEQNVYFPLTSKNQS